MKKNNNFTAVAMKCNQKQFDAIKPKLEENGCVIETISSFIEQDYLVNNLGSIEKTITNLSSFDKSKYNRTVFEEWNEEIFLNACGIETVKTYELTAEQLNKLASQSNWSKKFLKELYPDAFETETEVTQKELIDFYKKEKGIDNIKVVVK